MKRSLFDNRFEADARIFSPEQVIMGETVQTEVFCEVVEDDGTKITAIDPLRQFDVLILNRSVARRMTPAEETRFDEVLRQQEVELRRRAQAYTNTQRKNDLIVQDPEPMGPHRTVWQILDERAGCVSW